MLGPARNKLTKGRINALEMQADGYSHGLRREQLNQSLHWYLLLSRRC